MAARSLIVIGGGGFGREVIDVIDAINSHAEAPIWRVTGVLDDAPNRLNLARLEKRGVPYLGTVDASIAGRPPSDYIVGIGSPQVRRSLAARLDLAGWSAVTLVHPAATMGFDVRIGIGTVVCAGVRLTTNIGVGCHVHLNPNVTVGHDTEIGDFVSLNPASSVSGDCSIEHEVLVGVGAVILNRLSVGAGALIGGGACVVRDVPAGVVAKGVPARWAGAPS